MKKARFLHLPTVFILVGNWISLVLDGFESRKRLGIIICATIIYLLVFLLEWKKKDDMIPLLGIGGVVLVYLLYLIL